ncbi:MAG: hypothetical protein ACYC2H_12780 [Thermoplasmatota archaeon]
MSPDTLVVVGFVNAVTAASFAAVGARLARHRVEPQHRLAVRAIAAWWTSMGVLVGMQALEVFALVAGWVNLPLSTTARNLNAILLAVGGWGLCFHVLYLWTGNRTWARVLAPYYFLLAVAYLAAVSLHPLVGLEPTAYEATAIYDPPLEGSALWNAVVIAVGVPLIAASLLYLVLSRRLERRDQRRRARLASFGVLAWLSPALATHLVGSRFADFVTVTAFSFVAAVLVVLAYFPPAFMRRNDPAGPFLEVRRNAPPLQPDQQLWQR